MRADHGGEPGAVLKSWDPKSAGPVNRWFLNKVFLPAGGFSRFLGFVFLGFTVLVGGITAWVFLDPSSLQSDRDFFPIITTVFGAISLLFFLGWFVASRRARRTR